MEGDCGMKIKHQWAGAEWIAANLKREGKPEMSPLGIVVADILGFVFRGIYHIRQSALDRVDWADDHCISINIAQDLATCDMPELTMLVLACHKVHVRMSVESNMRYLKLMFWQRKPEGGTSTRHPTIEQQIEVFNRIFEVES